jgi:hypothetical protein
VPLLDPLHNVGDHLDRDVLRKDGKPAAPSYRLGHPAAGDRRHVRDHDRDGRPAAVRRAEVYVQS